MLDLCWIAWLHDSNCSLLHGPYLKAVNLDFNKEIGFDFEELYEFKISVKNLDLKFPSSLKVLNYNEWIQYRRKLL